MLKQDIFISERASIKDTLKKLDKTAKKILLVADEKNKLLGTITDGDIRRYILTGKNLENDIREIYNKKPIYIKEKDFSKDLVKEKFIEHRLELLPILDEENRVADFITWDELLSEGKIKPIKKSKINIPVVIMAGGKGARLEPFTRIIPKPLIPIGEKSVIEIILDEFRKQGVTEYYITINYKGEMIEAYFNSIEKDYKIQYVRENASLGTIGSIKLLEDRISDVFIVSNCDVIVRANFEEVVNFHKEQQAVLTVLSSLQYHRVPYGVIKFKQGGEVLEILEKPEYPLTVNAGVYVLSKECLRFISQDSPTDMTDLIKTLIENNKKVLIYPVSEKDYIDIGQWEEYKKAIGKLRSFI